MFTLQAVAGPPGPKGERVCHCCHYYDSQGIFNTCQGDPVLSPFASFFPRKKANPTAITIKLLIVNKKSFELTSL